MASKLIQLDLFRSEKEMQDLQNQDFNITLVKSLRSLFASQSDLKKAAKCLAEKTFEIEEVIFQINKKLDRVSEATFKNA